MRLLLLDATLCYLNPTRMLLPAVLAETGAELAFFGPGYTASGELASGLEAFIAAHDPFDAVLATEHILWARPAVSTPSVYRQLYDLDFPADDLRQCIAIAEALRRLPLRRVACLMETDYYNLQPWKIEHLDRYFPYVIGWGEPFVRPVDKLPELARETFGACANDNWLDFARSNAHRLVSLPHFVGLHEVWQGDIRHRAHDWAVPGTPYHARRVVRSLLPPRRVITRQRLRLRLVEVMRRLRLRPMGRKVVQDWLNAGFRAEIRSARHAFTCGSGLAWPIRKFFEIPALGTLLVCKPCSGFSDLGFVDGVNAVACEPERILELDAWLRTEPDRAAAIARAGQALVLRQHGTTARAAQLREALAAIVDGSFAGSRWEQGAFRVLRAPVAVEA